MNALFVLFLGAALQTPVEWELQTRRLALEPGRSQDELAQALLSKRWELRLHALDGLLRRAEFGGALDASWAAPVQERLFDPHPNVRARALAVLACLEPARLPGELACSLSEERLPNVRLALAEALDTLSCAAAGEVLARLCRDPDPRVQAAARASLVSVGAAEVKAELFIELFQAAGGREETLAFERFFRQLERAPPSLQCLAAIEERIAGANRTLFGLVQALRFSHAAGGDLEALIEAGWRADARPYRGLFLTAARSGDEGLARAFLQKLSAFSESDDCESKRAVDELVGALVCLVPPARLLELAMAEGLSEAGWVELMAEFGHRLERWDRALVRGFLQPTGPVEIRRATVLALGSTLGRRPEGWRETAALLVFALRDPEPSIAAAAWRALLRRPTAFQAELFETWRGWGVESRHARLGWFPRAYPLPAFRDDWLALGEVRATRRSACELLRPLVGDEKVDRALERWLTQELAGLSGPDGTPPPRAVELGVQALLATMSADVEGFFEAFEGCLERAIGVSTEVVESAFNALARCERGRLALAGYLTRETERRTRIEAALHLVGSPREGVGERAALEIAAGYGDADRELRARMLEALELASSDAAFDFLSSLVLSDRTSSEERALALSTLSKLEHPRLSQVLERTVCSAGDIEIRLMAARCLGRSGEREAIGVILRTMEVVLADVRLGDEERQLLRSELFLSMGRTGHFPEGSEHLLLDAPLASAGTDLNRRFLGQELPSPAFSWRAELHLAALLAGQRRVADILERSPGWTGLDGRLLVALGERVLEGGEEPAARRLLEAGLVALAGEDRPDPEVRLRARSRLLGLAWRQERFCDAERLARSLVCEYRAGVLPRAAFAQAFGVFEPQAGIDPRGRLESAVLQAAAWRALQDGEEEGARELARRARDKAGHSQLAAKEQERLEARL